MVAAFDTVLTGGVIEVGCGDTFQVSARPWNRKVRPNDDDSTADEFNENKAALMVAASVITGKIPRDIEGTYFSCAC